MKIIRDNVCYVQYNDLAMLHGSDELIPINIFMQVYGKGSFYVNDKNRYQFMRFDNPDDIEYFRNVSWMLNYDDVKDLNNEDIIEVSNSVQSSLKKRDISRTKKDMLEYLYCSIGDFYMFKNGDLDFELPDGIEYSYEFHTVVDEETVALKEDNGIKKFLKSFFGGRK